MASPRHASTPSSFSVTCWASDRPLDDGELGRLRPLVKRRAGREPLAWILGTQPFHAIELRVRPGVLVPRSDTETLVTAALECFAEPAETPLYVADVGSGTGAVGLALATARPDVRLYATDVDPIALAVTRDNVEALGLRDRVAVLGGDLLTPIPAERPIDWVVSNPPYIASGVLPTLEPEVARHEPRRALDGGRDGMDVYRRLIPAAARRARAGLLVEVGHDQSSRVVRLFKDHGLRDVATWRDLAGIERVVGGRVDVDTPT